MFFYHILSSIYNAKVTVSLSHDDINAVPIPMPLWVIYSHTLPYICIYMYKMISLVFPACLWARECSYSS